MQNGDNIFYIIVTDRESTVFNTYTLTIHRRYKAEIRYYNGEAQLYTETVMTGTDFEADYIPDIPGYTHQAWLDKEGNIYEGGVLWGALELYSQNIANTYKIRLDPDSGILSGEDKVDVTFGEEFVFPVPERTGYTFKGWKQDETLLTDAKGKGVVAWNISKNCTVVAVWEINEYELTLLNADEQYGSIEGAGRYKYNEEVTVRANPVKGYSLQGWYDGESLMSEDVTYTFRMPAGDVVYTARWMYYTLSTFSEQSDAGTFSVYTDEKVSAGTSILLKAETNQGYTWLGWFEEGEKLSGDTSYRLVMEKENKRIEARWMVCPVTVEYSDPKAGYVSGMPEYTVAGEEIELTATTNEGYTWLGWYQGDTLLTEEQMYSFIMLDSYEEIVYTAKWTYYTASASMDGEGYIHSAITFDLNGAEGSIPTQIVSPHGKTVYPELPKRDGYVFRGWYTEPECVNLFDFSKDLTGDVTLYAGWYKIDIKNYNDLSVIDIISNHNTELERFYMPNATSSSKKPNYVYFSTLTSGTYSVYFRNSGGGTNTIVSFTGVAGTGNNVYYSNVKTGSNYTRYEFKANAGDVFRFCEYRESTVSGEFSTSFYLYVTGAETPEAGGCSKAESSAPKVTVGKEVTFTAYDVGDGMLFLGWYDGDTLLTAEKQYTFTMPAHDVSYVAKWSKVQWELNDKEAGKVTSEVSGNTVTLTAETNNGYMWLGWYNGEELLSRDLVYTCNMPQSRVTYIAKWMPCPVTVEQNSEYAGTVTVLDEKYFIGEEVTITAQSNEEYIWLGWYDGEELLTEDLSFTFHLTEEIVAYTANGVRTFLI